MRRKSGYRMEKSFWHRCIAGIAVLVFLLGSMPSIPIFGFDSQGELTRLTYQEDGTQGEYVPSPSAEKVWNQGFEQFKTQMESEGYENVIESFDTNHMVYVGGEEIDSSPCYIKEEAGKEALQSYDGKGGVHYVWRCCAATKVEGVEEAAQTEEYFWVRSADKIELEAWEETEGASTVSEKEVKEEKAKIQTEADTPNEGPVEGENLDAEAEALPDQERAGTQHPTIEQLSAAGYRIDPNSYTITNTSAPEPLNMVLNNQRVTLTESVTNMSMLRREIEGLDCGVFFFTPNKKPPVWFAFYVKDGIEYGCEYGDMNNAIKSSNPSFYNCNLGEGWSKSGITMSTPQSLEDLYIEYREDGTEYIYYPYMDHNGVSANFILGNTGFVRMVDIPLGQTLTYNGEVQAGVPDTENYTVTGTSNAVNVGEYTATVSLTEGYSWADGTTSDKQVNWSIIPRAINEVTADAIEDQVYSGSAVTPNPTLTYNQMTLEKNTDYSLNYVQNTGIGTGTVIVTGKGNYTGQISLDFVIKGPVCKVGSVGYGTLEEAIEAVTALEKLKPDDSCRIQMLVDEYEIKGALPSMTFAYILETASKTDEILPFQGTKDVATIKRGFNGTTMFRCTGDVVFENIIIDGNQESYEGTIIRHTGGEVTMGNGCVFTNAKSANGAVFSTASFGRFIMKEGALGTKNHSTFAGGFGNLGRCKFIAEGGVLSENSSDNEGGTLIGQSIKLGGNFEAFGNTARTYGSFSSSSNLDIEGNVYIHDNVCTEGDASVENSAAINNCSVKISGAARIVNNKGPDGKSANVEVTQDFPMKVTGNLTGEIGILAAGTIKNTVGEQFATGWDNSTDSETPVAGYQGLEHLVNDKNPVDGWMLYGKAGEGSKIIWSGEKLPKCPLTLDISGAMPTLTDADGEIVENGFTLNNGLLIFNGTILERCSVNHTAGEKHQLIVTGENPLLKINVKGSDALKEKIAIEVRGVTAELLKFNECGSVTFSGANVLGGKDEDSGLSVWGTDKIQIAENGSVIAYGTADAEVIIWWGANKSIKMLELNMDQEVSEETKIKVKGSGGGQTITLPQGGQKYILLDNMEGTWLAGNVEIKEENGPLNYVRGTEESTYGKTFPMGADGNETFAKYQNVRLQNKVRQISLSIPTRVVFNIYTSGADKSDYGFIAPKYEMKNTSYICEDVYTDGTGSTKEFEKRYSEVSVQYNGIQQTDGKSSQYKLLGYGTVSEEIMKQPADTNPIVCLEAVGDGAETGRVELDENAPVLNPQQWFSANAATGGGIEDAGVSILQFAVPKDNTSVKPWYQNPTEVSEDGYTLRGHHKLKLDFVLP